MPCVEHSLRLAWHVESFGACAESLSVLWIACALWANARPIAPGVYDALR